MEVVGKMMILFVLIGGLGLGVSEIMTRDVSEIDILDIPFRSANDDLDAIDQYKEELITESEGYMHEVKQTSDVPAPDALWKQEADENFVSNAHAGSSIAEKLAYSNTSTDLRKKMLLWHKKYHSALRNNGSKKDVQVAYESYQNYKAALDLKLQ